MRALTVSAALILSGIVMNETRRTRGERNNNPGNIRGSGTLWAGQVGSDDKGFVVFDSPVNGIRAIRKVLETYFFKRDIRTIAGMISRWAPSSENDTSSYIASVARHVRTAPYELLSERDFRAMLPSLIEAIIKHENGRVDYAQATLDAGLALA